MPNRIIKESICSSESIASLSFFEECLFYRLIVNCDDYGRFDGRTAILKGRLFPLHEKVTAKMIEDGLKKLVAVNLVRLYEHDGKPYLFLPTWANHQSIRNKRSKYPEPSADDYDLQANDFNCKQMSPYSYSESESESKSEYESNAHTRTSEIDERFDRFWDEYPRHEKKKDARKAFGTLNVTDELLEQMLDAVRRQKASKQWQDAQYIPMPTTWLHGRRWEDEPMKVQKPQGRLDGLKALLEQTEREEQGL